MLPSFALSLIALLALGGQQAVAECYGKGDKWPSNEEARVMIEDACQKQNGMFTGSFHPQQQKSMCVPSGVNTGVKLFFSVQNLNNRDSFDLDDTDCFQRLSNEVFGCERGGQTDVAGWRFRSDPGQC